MAAEILIPLGFFAFIFGIFYLFFTTRHKERMMLIEKGEEASIFFNDKERKSAPTWKILIINLGLVLTGIGIGIFVSIILQDGFGIQNDGVIPACIFTLAGLGLMIGYQQTKKI